MSGSASAERLLLDSAAQVLVARGAAAFTLRKVAEQAGTSLGHLQYYYASKSLLVKALIDDLAQRFWQYYERRLLPVNDPMDRFMGCAEFLLYSGPQRDMVVLLREYWAISRQDEEVAAAVNVFYSASSKLAASLIAEINPNLSEQSAAYLGAEATALISGAFLFTEGFGAAEPLSGFTQHVLRRLQQLPWTEVPEAQ